MPALDLFRKLNPWHKGKHPPTPAAHHHHHRGPPHLPLRPLLLPPLLSVPQNPPIPTISRDSPSVIRARIRSVTLSCLLCTATTYVVLTRPGIGDSTVREALHFLGLWPVGVCEAGRVLGLTGLLFAGPLFGYFVVEKGWREWVRLGPVREVWEEWTGWRNIFAGPVTEEILFRTASIPLMLLSQSPLPQTIFLTPILFGLAHVHHFYEFRLIQPQVPASAAFLRSLFQFAYTTVFGAYATFLYIRSGSLLAVCIVHAFCNCMGLPQVWGRVEPEAADVVPVVVGGCRWEAYWGAVARRPSILWTVAYYVLLVGGAVMWWKKLWVLSESENGLVPSSAFFKV